MEYAVVGPYTGSNLFVDADPLWVALARLEALRSFVEFAVLR
jgi:hypothetical protein